MSALAAWAVTKRCCVFEASRTSKFVGFLLSFSSSSGDCPHSAFLQTREIGPNQHFLGLLFLFAAVICSPPTDPSHPFPTTAGRPGAFPPPPTPQPPEPTRPSASCLSSRPQDVVPIRGADSEPVKNSRRAVRALMTLRALAAPASLSPEAWLGSYTWCKCLTDTFVSFPSPLPCPHATPMLVDVGLCHGHHEEASRTPAPGKSRPPACSSWS